MDLIASCRRGGGKNPFSQNVDKSLVFLRGIQKKTPEIDLACSHNGVKTTIFLVHIILRNDTQRNGQKLEKIRQILNILLFYLIYIYCIPFRVIYSFSEK